MLNKNTRTVTLSKKSNLLWSYLVVCHKYAMLRIQAFFWRQLSHVSTEPNKSLRQLHFFKHNSVPMQHQQYIHLLKHKFIIWNKIPFCHRNTDKYTTERSKPINRWDPLSAQKKKEEYPHPRSCSALLVQCQSRQAENDADKVLSATLKSYCTLS